MWKCLKELLPGKSKASPKGLLIDEQIITDKLQMTNTFNQYFTGPMTPYTPHFGD